MDSKELEKLKKQEEQRQQMQEKVDTILTQILTAEAKERINRIKLVKPERAEVLTANLIRLSQTGKLQIPVTEEFLIRLLENTQEAAGESKIKIQRKRMDDDDDF
eukprot:TRINITY_DN423_c0_g1_i3.p1 TRINITY_DN423_c0_g1~~TRINITY_DN423_c0_g1_i3.p1  ORF type:complete len:105 (-),score=35.76 TRINITY_DN423_c0_g1_i3:171-485(-)